VPAPTLTASLTQVVPFERKKLPVVLGATKLDKADDPFPKITLFAVIEETPVPPSATAKSVIPETAPPVIVAPELEKVLAVRLPEITVAPLKVVAPVADKVENAPVEGVVAPIVVPLIEPPVMTILAGLIDAADAAAAVAELAALVALVDAELAELLALVAEVDAAEAELLALVACVEAVDAEPEAAVALPAALVADVAASPALVVAIPA